jgi:hypothetical protein
MFFISVDSGGFRLIVSCLESTLAGWLVSVAFKWVRASVLGGSCGGGKAIGSSRELDLDYE